MKHYLILLALVPSLILAGGDPHHDPEPQPDPEPITIVKKPIVNEYTTINQYSDNSSAVLAMAHRSCKDCGLFSGSISISNISKVGVGIGYTWSY